MSGTQMADPIRFEPGMELPDPHEAETTHKLDEALSRIRETVFADRGHACRSVHAKSHGILRARVTVPGDLPPLYSQGLFAQAGAYDAVMRFSTIPGDVLSDDVSVPRGLAVKVIGVAGARLPGSEGDATQDFVMADAPAFAAPTPRKFLANLKLLARTTDKFEGLKGTLSHAARGIDAVLARFGKKSPLVRTLGGHPAVNVLGETYYSQTPFLYGPYYAKFRLLPASDGLVALKGQKVPVRERPNALREAVIHHFDGAGAAWDFQVQLATDAGAMPVEDASAVWPEEKSPFVTVARVEAPPQDAWSEARQRSVEDGVAFSVWHGLAAHRPLGGVNRVRRDTYRQSALFRGGKTGCPMHEPASGAALEV